MIIVKGWVRNIPPSFLIWLDTGQIQDTITNKQQEFTATPYLRGESVTGQNLSHISSKQAVTNLNVIFVFTLQRNHKSFSILSFIQVITAFSYHFQSLSLEFSGFGFYITASNIYTHVSALYNWNGQKVYNKNMIIQK